MLRWLIQFSHHFQAPTGPTILPISLMCLCACACACVFVDSLSAVSRWHLHLENPGRPWNWSTDWTTASRFAAPAWTILHCGATGVNVTTSTWTVRTVFWVMQNTYKMIFLFFLLVLLFFPWQTERVFFAVVSFLCNVNVSLSKTLFFNLWRNCCCDIEIVFLAMLVALAMALDHFGQEWNISASIQWIDMKFCTDIRGAHAILTLSISWLSLQLLKMSNTLSYDQIPNITFRPTLCLGLIKCRCVNLLN